ncbi:hypothetical protein TRICI_002408 [Trichomonascus ciferrii]|uniref:Uncharacterized protein n=1 Tax=Trichomonascus ciferrii TaxID=44093 RepID=A0A642V5W4_9ASCO|nr:hypothetical protein TRICI_002408 [Trichomonascus ciferrii]
MWWYNRHKLLKSDCPNFKEWLSRYRKAVKRKYKVEVNDDHTFSFPKDPTPWMYEIAMARKRSPTPDNEDSVENAWALMLVTIHEADSTYVASELDDPQDAEPIEILRLIVGKYKTPDYRHLMRIVEEFFYNGIKDHDTFLQKSKEIKPRFNKSSVEDILGLLRLIDMKTSNPPLFEAVTASPNFKLDCSIVNKIIYAQSKDKVVANLLRRKHSRSHMVKVIHWTSSTRKGNVLSVVIRNTTKTCVQTRRMRIHRLTKWKTPGISRVMRAVLTQIRRASSTIGQAKKVWRTSYRLRGMFRPWEASNTALLE